MDVLIDSNIKVYAILANLNRCTASSYETISFETDAMVDEWSVAFGTSKSSGVR
jgi:hypothetical protein